MKKVIVIVAVLVVALVGLTSYNNTEVKKNKGNGNLIAELKTDPIRIATNTGGGGKKRD